MCDIWENDANHDHMVMPGMVYLSQPTEYGTMYSLNELKEMRNFFTFIKQRGALLAKGRVLGIQFDELFRDGLYFSIGSEAVRLADRIRDILKRHGYRLAFDSPTNQIFVVLDNHEMARLNDKLTLMYFTRRPHIVLH